MEPMSPFEPTILGAVWRHRLLVAACGAIAVVMVLIVWPPGAREYRARASLVLRPPSSSDPQFTAQPSRYAADQIAIIESRPVAERALEVAARDGVDPGMRAREVMDRSKVSGTVEKNNLVNVTFQARTPRVAIAMANAVVTAYRDTRQSRSAAALRQIDTSLENVERQLGVVRGDLERASAARGANPVVVADLVRRQKELEDQRDTFRIQRNTAQSELDTGAITLFSPATEASVAGTYTKRKMAAALVIGLLAGAVLAYVRAVRRVNFSRSEEPEFVSGAPLLSEIPARSRGSVSLLPVVADRHSPDAEAFRFAAAFLEVQTNPSRNVIAVVSGSRDDGSTPIAVNTAIAMAQAGVRVALVDADVEGQRASRLVLGDGALLAARNVLQDSFQLFRPMGRVLKSGDFLDLLEATGGRTLIDPLFTELKSQFDVVIVDVPPLLQSPYAATFLSCAEGAIVVVNHKADVSEYEDVASRLRSIGTPAIGYIYNYNRSRSGLDRLRAASVGTRFASRGGRPFTSRMGAASGRR